MPKSQRKRWEPRNLDELGFIGRGKSRHRPRNDPSLYGGPYPFFQTGDVKGANLYLYEYSQSYNEKGLAQSKLWEPGTLCITIAANIAETAILKIKGCFPDSVVGFIADENKAYTRFIKYYIDTIKMQMQSASLGTTQDNLSLDKLLTFKILAPCLPLQKKIAAILSAYDDLIENNTRRIKILEEMAQAIYREWFVNFRFPEHEKVKMVDSQMGKIPEGWTTKRIGERFTAVLGGTPSREKLEFWENGTIPWINSGKVNEIRVLDASEMITDEGLRKSSTKMMPKRTTLVAITGATLGQVSLLEIEACANQSVVGIHDREKLFSEFIYLFFHESISAIIQHASGGAQQHINKEIVNAVQIVLPPYRTIERFNSLIHPIFDLTANLLWKNKNLRQTRNLLLPKLISGGLDVSDLDIKTDATENG